MFGTRLCRIRKHLAWTFCVWFVFYCAQSQLKLGLPSYLLWVCMRSTGTTTFWELQPSVVQLFGVSQRGGVPISCNNINRNRPKSKNMSRSKNTSLPESAIYFGNLASRL